MDKPMDLKIIVSCRLCEKLFDFTANLEDYNEWRKGEKNIQDCFPYLNPDQRELLLSGICNTCWDKMFKEHEEVSSTRQEGDEDD